MHMLSNKKSKLSALVTVTLTGCLVNSAEKAKEVAASSTTLWDVIVDGGFISILIWLMLFAVSLAAILLGIHCAYKLTSSNFYSKDDALRVKLLLKDKMYKPVLEAAKKSGSAFSIALLSLLKHHKKGEEKAGSIAARDLEEFSDGINRHIGTLLMCGNIAPMLGLLGTVTGMVSAFMGLGAAVGAEKASALAISISQALYTTAAGLLIAVPALVGAHLARNKLEHKIAETVHELENATSSLWEN